MINQNLSVTPTKTRQVQFPSTVVTPGTPMFLGNVPCINLDSYQANIGGATCYFDGSYFLPVVGKSSLSPSVNAAIKPGDKIYASGGSRDATTNVLTGFTLCADSSGILFGTLNSQADTIAAGDTNDAAAVDISL